MGADQKVVQVSDVVDEVSLLSLYADLRVPLKDAGVGSKGGQILLVSDKEKMEAVIQEFMLYGGIKGEIHGSRIPKGLNYKTVLVIYQPFYKEEAIESFLACDEYFPVLMVCGMIPDKLRRYSNIIILESVNTDLAKTAIRVKYFKKATEYFHNRVNRIYDFVRGVLQEAFQGKYPQERRPYNALVFTSGVYALYLAEVFASVESARIVWEYENDVCLKMFKAIEMEDEGDSVLFMVRKAFAKYVDEHDDILFGHIEKVEGELMKKLEEKKAVLYDSNFYYINAERFQEVIESFQHVISYLSVKQLLYQSGVLAATMENGYTVKKVIVNAYGETFRCRFIKLKREMIDDEVGLTLAERGSRNVPVCG